MSVAVCQKLQAKANNLVSTARNHPLARLVVSKREDDQALRAAIRNVLLRVHFYGPAITRSVFQSIGRIVAADPELARQLVDFEFEEAPHPGLAFRDYVKLGGEGSLEHQSDHSPAAFVVAATVESLSRHPNPYAFLGYLYLLESTTPEIIEGIVANLGGGALAESVEFLSLHRTQDKDHARTLARLIDEISARDEEAGRAIDFAYECFSIVYPLPIWTEVLAEIHPEAAGEGPWSRG